MHQAVQADFDSSSALYSSVYRNSLGIYTGWVLDLGGEFGVRESGCKPSNLVQRTPKDRRPSLGIRGSDSWVFVIGRLGWWGSVTNSKNVCLKNQVHFMNKFQ